MLSSSFIFSSVLWLVIFGLTFVSFMILIAAYYPDRDSIVYKNAVIGFFWSNKIEIAFFSFIAFLFCLFLFFANADYIKDTYFDFKEAKQKIETEEYFTPEEISKYTNLNNRIWDKENNIKLSSLKECYREEIKELGKLDIKLAETKRFLSIKANAGLLEAERSINSK